MPTYQKAHVHKLAVFYPDYGGSAGPPVVNLSLMDMAPCTSSSISTLTLSIVVVLAVAMTYMGTDPAVIGNPWWVAKTFDLNQFNTGTGLLPSLSGPADPLPLADSGVLCRAIGLCFRAQSSCQDWQSQQLRMSRHALGQTAYML